MGDTQTQISWDEPSVREMIEGRFSEALSADEAYLTKVARDRMSEADTSHIAVALNERLSALRKSGAIEDIIEEQFNNPEVRRSLRSQNFSQSDIEDLKNKMVRNAEEALDSFASPGNINRLMEVQVGEMQDDLPRLMSEGIRASTDKFIERVVRNAEQGRLELEETLRERDAILERAEEAQRPENVANVQNEQLEMLAQAYATQLRAMPQKQRDATLKAFEGQPYHDRLSEILAQPDGNQSSGPEVVPMKP